MEQLVILLVIAAIALINWFLQKSVEHKSRQGRAGGSDSPKSAPGLPPWGDHEPDDAMGRATPPIPPAPPPGGRDEGEERVRRFLEAMGLPTTDEAWRREPEISLPFESAPPPLPVPRVVSVPARPPGRTLRKKREMRELAEQFDLSAIDAASDTGTTAAFRELLQDPSTIRQGIILREILGPPKALES